MSLHLTTVLTTNCDQQRE